MSGLRQIVGLASAVTAICFISHTHAEPCDTSKPLKIISDYVADVCTSIPLNSTSVELSASGKVELNKLIAKLAGIGVTGAAKYQDSKSFGVL
jgi:hypothetical protein